MATLASGFLALFTDTLSIRTELSSAFRNSIGLAITS
jgi:hypothetical protein